MAIIYTLEHPLTGYIRFVGSSRNHLALALKSHNDTRGKRPINVWVRELRDASLLPKIKQVETCDQNKVPERMAWWIKFLAENGIDLINLQKRLPRSSSYVPVDTTFKYIYFTREKAKGRGFVSKSMMVWRCCGRCGNSFSFFFTDKVREHCSVSCASTGRAMTAEQKSKIRKAKLQPVIATKGSVVQHFDSVEACARYINRSQSGCSNVLSGRFKTIGGWQVKYKGKPKKSKNNEQKKQTTAHTETVLHEGLHP